MLASRRQASIAVRSGFLAVAGLAFSTEGLAFTVGSGHIASESRIVGDFQAIAIEDSMDLAVLQGSQTAVRVQADDNLLPLLQTVVDGGSHGPLLRVR